MAVPNFELRSGCLLYPQDNAICAALVSQEQTGATLLAVAKSGDNAAAYILYDQARKTVLVVYGEKCAFFAVCAVQSKGDAAIVEDAEPSAFITVCVV